MIKRILFIIILIALFVSGWAQYGSFGVTDARSFGMGNTYNATAYGMLSVGKNPGWLHTQDKNLKVSVIFPNLTAQAYGFNQAFSTFDYYFGDINRESINRLSDEKFLAVLDNDGKLFMDGLVGFLAVSYTPSEKLGTFAFSVSDYISTFLDIPNVVVTAINDKEKIAGQVSLDDFVYKTWWIRTFGLSYSRTILQNRYGFLRKLDGGITLKYIKGFAYQTIVLQSSVGFSNQQALFGANIQGASQSSFSDELTALDVFNTFKSKSGELYWPKSASTAYGFDIGLGMALDHGLKVGLPQRILGAFAGTRTLQKIIFQEISRLPATWTWKRSILFPPISLFPRAKRTIFTPPCPQPSGLEWDGRPMRHSPFSRDTFCWV